MASESQQGVIEIYPDRRYLNLVLLSLFMLAFLSVIWFIGVSGDSRDFNIATLLTLFCLFLFFRGLFLTYTTPPKPVRIFPGNRIEYNDISISWENIDFPRTHTNFDEKRWNVENPALAIHGLDKKIIVIPRLPFSKKACSKILSALK